jgi:Senescence-associated protein
LVLGLEIAKSTSGMAVAITNAMASTMQVIKIGLSHYLAKIIAKHGSKLMPEQHSTDPLHDKRLEEIFEICMSLNEAHATIEQGLNEAATVLRKSLNENSLVLVEHIYGEPTVKAIREAIETKRNTKQIAANLKGILVSPTVVAKQVLKSAGKELLSTAFGNKRKTEGDDATDSCGSVMSKRLRIELEKDAGQEDEKDEEDKTTKVEKIV